MKHTKLILLVLLAACGVAVAQTAGVPQSQYLFNHNSGVVTEDVAHTTGDHLVGLSGVATASGSGTLAGVGDYTPIATTTNGAVRIAGELSDKNDQAMISGGVPTAPQVSVMGIARADATALASVSAAGDNVLFAANLQGQQLVRIDHPNRFSCGVINSNATVLTALSGCAAPGAGLSLYITDITASSSVISTVTTDQYLSLKSGTGGACGTGTATVWASYNLAHAPIHAQLLTPIKVAANSELCWMHAAAGNKTFIVNGFIAP